MPMHEGNNDATCSKTCNKKDEPLERRLTSGQSDSELSLHSRLWHVSRLSYSGKVWPAPQLHWHGTSRAAGECIAELAVQTIDKHGKDSLQAGFGMCPPVHNPLVRSWGMCVCVCVCVSLH